MLQTVPAGKLELGLGAPAICVPLTGPTTAQVLQQAQAAQTAADLLEWRADLWAPQSEENPLTVLGQLREAAPERPLLFTLRSQAEGGGDARPGAEVADQLCRVAASGLAGLVDCELRLGRDCVQRILQAGQKAGCRSIVSHHYFAGMPTAAEMDADLEQMAALGADLPKLAVMPGTPEDVLALLAATAGFVRRYSRPVITMAMGPLGVISRLSGEFFGSCLTFGTVGASSAPGQLPAAELRPILALLHRQLQPQNPPDAPLV